MSDREKVIKALQTCSVQNDVGCQGCPYFEERKKYGHEWCTTSMAQDALELLKEQQPRWISVEEALPKSIINKVLVYLEHDDLVGYIGFGHFERWHGEEIWFDLEHDDTFADRGYRVTHWMELPEKPKT